jgi:hypothetical protein
MAAISHFILYSFSFLFSEIHYYINLQNAQARLATLKLWVRVNACQPPLAPNFSLLLGSSSEMHARHLV